MGREATAEYLATMRARYLGSDRQAKGVLLDEICAVTGWHRKAVIRRLGRRPAARATERRQRRRYGPLEAAALRQVWEAADRPCGKRLAPFLTELVPVLERHGELTVTPAVRERLLTMSAATIDRLLRPTRLVQPRGGTRAARALAAEIAVRTAGEWQDVAPGAMQADLVLHCGVTTAGFYLATLVLVDVATGWVEVEPTWGLSQERVGGAVFPARRRLPFRLRELHTDNGAEFINRRLLDYCRRHEIGLTRGRPYKKNDQAWVEQRNWTAVRRLVGYGRFSSKAAFAALADAYVPPRAYFAFFQPLRKVVAKERHGARVVKRFDLARIPYQRLLLADALDPHAHRDLEQRYRDLNPVLLRASLYRALDDLRPLADPDRGWLPAPDATPIDGPAHPASG